MRCQVLEFPVAVGHDAPQGENDYLRDAAILLRQMVAEIEPLAELSAARATAIEAVQRDVEALIPIVEFMPMVSEGPILNELKQMAKVRITCLAHKLAQILLAS